VVGISVLYPLSPILSLQGEGGLVIQNTKIIFLLTELPSPIAIGEGQGGEVEQTLNSPIAELLNRPHPWSLSSEEERGTLRKERTGFDFLNI